MIKIYGSNSYAFNMLLNLNLINNFQCLFHTQSEYNGMITYEQAGAFMSRAPHIRNGERASSEIRHKTAEALTLIYDEILEDETVYELCRFHLFLVNELIHLTVHCIPEYIRVITLAKTQAEWRYVIGNALDERPLEEESDEWYVRNSAVYVFDTALPMRKLSKGAEYGSFLFPTDAARISFAPVWDAANDGIPPDLEDIAYDLDGLQIDDPLRPGYDESGGYDKDAPVLHPDNRKTENADTVAGLQQRIRDDLDLRREAERQADCPESLDPYGDDDEDEDVYSPEYGPPSSETYKDINNRKPGQKKGNPANAGGEKRKRKRNRKRKKEGDDGKGA